VPGNERTPSNDRKHSADQSGPITVSGGRLFSVRRVPNAFRLKVCADFNVLNLASNLLALLAFPSPLFSQLTQLALILEPLIPAKCILLFALREDRHFLGRSAELREWRKLFSLNPMRFFLARFNN
jgi:hypothetical protein